MMVKNFTKVFFYEVGLLLKNRTLIIFMVGLPLLLFLFFIGFMESGVLRGLPIAVVDQDQTASSRELQSYIEATPEMHVSHRETSRLAAEALVRKAEVYGFIVIPKGFGADLQMGRQPQIINQFNQNLLLPGGLQSRAVRAAVNTLSAKVQLKTQLMRGKTMAAAKASLEPVRLDAHIISNPFLNYRFYLLAGFLTMFLQVFVMLTTIYVVGHELKYGKGYALMKMAENNLFVVVLGKLLPYTLWFFLLGLLLHTGMYLIMDYPVNGSKAMLLLALLLLILATQAFAFWFTVGSKDLRAAMMKGNAMAAVSLTMSGFTFPVMAMLPFFQWLVKLFPFVHYFKVFKDLTQRGVPAFYVMPQLIVLAVMVLALFLLGWRKYKKLLTQGGYLATPSYEAA